jgi:hypothetical protein
MIISNFTLAAALASFFTGGMFFGYGFCLIYLRWIKVI